MWIQKLKYIQDSFSSLKDKIINVLKKIKDKIHIQKFTCFFTIHQYLPTTCNMKKAD